ncbi:hypothetical protein [Streptomyces alboviridis]|uniref:hypothetical protein n=2 Tax=Streptomyces TaxID=1883 RepID=UPI00131A4C81|nr:hypothetical protein [Streptomyces alboviridis]
MEVFQPNPALGATMQTTAIPAAAIVAAGTIAVLAPVDPKVFRPAETETPATVLGFTAILLADAALRDQAQTTDRVRTHLGYSPYWMPRPDLGETATTLIVWDQHELNALYERVGGTVTTRQAVRSIDDGHTTWPATEITLTVHVPDVGPVTVSTDWDEEIVSHDLPLARGLSLTTAA